MGLYIGMGELDGVVYDVCVNIATLVFCEHCTDTHTTQLRRGLF
jgi:AhpD family alkylhydroperoxidase